MSRDEEEQETAITNYQINYSERQERDNHRKVGHELILNTTIHHIILNLQ